VSTSIGMIIEMFSKPYFRRINKELEMVGTRGAEMDWLDKNEGTLIKLLSTLLIGFGTGFFLINDYHQGFESILIGVLLYGIYRIGIKLDQL